MGLVSSKIASSPSQRTVVKALKLFLKVQDQQNVFFKKDDCFHKNNIVVEHVIQKYVGVVDKNLTITFDPDAPNTIVFSESLVHYLKSWLYGRLATLKLLCQQMVHGLGHTVLLALRKTSMSVYVTYVDPYVYPLNQPNLLSHYFSAVLGAKAIPVHHSIGCRNTVEGLFVLVRQVTHRNEVTWELELFYTAHALLQNYRHDIQAPKRTYDKLIRLGPRLLDHF